MTTIGMKRTTQRKPMKKKSTRTISSMKRKVWDAFSKFKRTEDCLRTTGCADWGLCFTCGNLTN